MAWFDDIEWQTVDLRASTMAMKLKDGRTVSGTLNPQQFPSEFVAWTLYPSRSEIVLTTADGIEMEIELFDGSDIRTRRGRRPVIYLDQNKWSQIAADLEDRRAAPARGGGAAARLIEAARAREVLLPLSAGHYVETGPLFADKRTRLASQMVALSRGWMMTNPLTIRANELIEVLSEAAGTRPSPHTPPFSLSPQLLFSDPIGDSDDPWRADLRATDPRAEHWVGAQSLLAVLLEREAVEDPSDAPTAQAWADSMSRFALALSNGSRDHRKLRKATLQHLFTDLGEELPTAAAISGIHPDQFARWIEHDSEDAIQGLPALGRYRELIHRRLMDPHRRWHRNDLVDLVFLSAAAGYADHVVCERRTGQDLRRVAESVSPGASVYLSLGDLVDDLGL